MPIEILEKVENLITEHKTILEQLDEHARAAIEQHAKHILHAHPWILSITWRQTIPSFNDGEPCLFTLSELEVEVAGYNNIYTEQELQYYEKALKDALAFHEDPESWRQDYRIRYKKQYSRELNEEYVNRAKPYPLDVEEIQGCIEDITNFLQAHPDANEANASLDKLERMLISLPESVLEKCFGINSVIAITAEGVSVEDYYEY